MSKYVLHYPGKATPAFATLPFPVSLQALKALLVVQQFCPIVK